MQSYCIDRYSFLTIGYKYNFTLHELIKYIYFTRTTTTTNIKKKVIYFLFSIDFNLRSKSRNSLENFSFDSASSSYKK